MFTLKIWRDIISITELNIAIEIEKCLSKILRQRRNAGRSQRLSARAGKERTYAL